MGEQLLRFRSRILEGKIFGAVSLTQGCCGKARQVEHGDVPVGTGEDGLGDLGQWEEYSQIWLVKGERYGVLIPGTQWVELRLAWGHLVCMYLYNI